MIATWREEGWKHIRLHPCVVRLWSQRKHKKYMQRHESCRCQVYTGDHGVASPTGNHIDERPGALKGTAVTVGEQLSGFKYSTFPYDFSMAAYLDLGE